MSISLLIFQLIGVVPLLAICSVGPGLFFVRRMRWRAEETLCAAVAGSMIFVGVGSMGIFWLNLQPVGGMHWGLTAICLALDMACWRDLVRLFRSKSVRQMVWTWLVFLIWCVLLVSLIRYYGGGMWWGDWLEHYQRSQFFLAHGRSDYRFLGEYLIVDRPPLMNLICGHFMAQVGTEFWVYQFVAVVLNSLAVLPCCLFVRSVEPRRRGTLAVLLLLLVANPMFVQNVTFVWTKAFAAFFALVGLWMYLRGWLKGDRSRLTAAFVTITAGCLIHLYVAVWLAFLAGHYLIVVWRGRRERLREVGMIAVLCAVLLGSWYGWAIQNYGVGAIFNSQVTQPFPGLKKVDAWTLVRSNVVDTIVPYFLRWPPYANLEQNDWWGHVRDLAFNLYQTNAIFVFGSMGAAVLVLAIARGVLPWRRWPGGLRQFWAWFVVVTTVVGLCIVPRPEAWGAAHLCMLPLVLLGLCALAGAVGRLALVWRVCLLGGCVVDFLLGILLHVHLEGRTFEVVTTSLPWRLAASAFTPSHVAGSNFLLKVQNDLYFIGDAAAPGGVWIEVAVCGIFVAVFVRTVWVMRGV